MAAGALVEGAFLERDRHRSMEACVVVALSYDARDATDGRNVTLDVLSNF